MKKPVSTSSNRKGRKRPPRGETLTISRGEFLDALPAPPGPEGVFVSACYANPLSFSSLRDIARLYGEFRFRRLSYRLVPKGAAGDGGQLIGAHMFVPPPGQPGDMKALAAMTGFRVSPVHKGTISFGCPLRLSLRRWYLVPDTLTPALLLDPMVMQCWSFLGVNNPGTMAQVADIYVTYTVTLRGPKATGGPVLVPLGVLPSMQAAIDDDADSLDDLVDEVNDGEDYM